MPWLLAQDPVGIGESLGQAQGVQQILGIIIGMLLLALLAVVAYHLREVRRWQDKYDHRIKQSEKSYRRMERTMAAMAGNVADSRDDSDEED